jgi:hypothetical protein
MGGCSRDPSIAWKGEPVTETEKSTTGASGSNPASPEIHNVRTYEERYAAFGQIIQMKRGAYEVHHS